MRPVLFEVFGLPINSYGVSKAAAVLVAGYLLAREFHRLGWDGEKAWPMVVWATVAGFAGGKLYYLAEHADSLSPHSFGPAGFTWYGGLIAGSLTIVALARRHRIPLTPLAGIVAAPLSIAYGIGRIGCFLAGDGTYGKPSDLPWAMAFPHGTVPTLVRVHPTALYEAALALALGALLWAVRTRAGAADRLRAVRGVQRGRAIPRRGGAHQPRGAPRADPAPAVVAAARRGRDRAADHRAPHGRARRGPMTESVLAGADTGNGRDRGPMVTVLVVDDEPKIRELVGAYLQREGYHVLMADTGLAALRTTERLRPDLLVLDLGLPDLPGEELLRLLRRTSDIPVIMLTARASEGDRVAGLRLGADDYVTKPFSPRELVARVEAVLRRAGGGPARRTPTFAGGRLALDQERREVLLDGVQLDLTRTEFDLLAVLSSRPGRAWSRYELVSRVQGHDYEGYERTVDAHVKNLRRKLGDDPRSPTFVVTLPAIGYKFGPSTDE